MKMETISELGRIAQMQWGLVTTRQAEAAGVSRMQISRMAAGGALERITQGVYRMAGAPAAEDEEIFAAWLALTYGARAGHTQEEEVVVAGAAAARLHGIGDLWLDPIDFVSVVPRTSRNPLVRIRTAEISANDTTLVDGVPVLTPMRTIADLVAQWVDLSLVADALRDASGRGMFDAADLARCLEPIASRDGHSSGAAYATELAEIAGIVPLDRAA